MRAYTVVKRKGQDDFWLPIGAAFSHKDEGYNVILQALPIPDSEGVCKIVLRPPKDQEDAEAKGNVRQLDKSGSRRR